MIMMRLHFDQLNVHEYSSSIKCLMESKYECNKTLCALRIQMIYMWSLWSEWMNGPTSGEHMCDYYKQQAKIKYHSIWFDWSSRVAARPNDVQSKVFISGKMILFHRLLSWKMIPIGFASHRFLTIWTLLTLIPVLFRLYFRSSCFIILYHSLSHFAPFNLF